MNKEKLLNISNLLILFFLTLQIASVNISIASASISIGFWGGIWILQMLFLGSYKEFKQMPSETRYFTIFLIAYCTVEILSRIFAVFPQEAYEGLRRMPLALIFFITILKVNSRESLRKILSVILTSMSLISVIELIRFGIELGEILQTGNFINNRLGYFSYPLTTAEMKMLFIVLLFPLAAMKGALSKKEKTFLLILLTPIILSAVLTMSRNVYVSLFVSSLLFGIFISRKALIYMAASLLILWLVLPSPYKTRINTIFQPNDQTNLGRFAMWDTGWKMFLKHPVLGVGDNKIEDVYLMFKKPEYHGEGSHMHSNFFQIIATSGLAGTFTFWGMFISLFIGYIKTYRKTKNSDFRMLIFGSILALISFQIAGIFEWIYGDWEVMCVFWFVSSIPFVLKKIENQNKLI